MRTPNGELRPGTEGYHGYKTLAKENMEASLVTTQRNRLNLNYKTDGITTKLVLVMILLFVLAGLNLSFSKCLIPALSLLPLVIGEVTDYPFDYQD